MRSCLGVVIFIFLVFPCAIGGMCLLAANTWIFDKDFYVDSLDNEALYEGLLQDLPDYLDTKAFDREFERDQAFAANRAIAMGLREVVTSQYLRGETLRVIDEAFTLIDGNNDVLEVAVDLRPVKAVLLDEGRNDFARAMAANLPRCESGQEPRGADDALISCMSSNMPREEAEEQILHALPRYVEELPNKLTVIDPVSADAVDFGVGTARDSLRGVILSFLFFAAIFWLTAAWIGGESRRQRLLWLGIMLLIPAGFVFLAGASIGGDWLDSASRALDSADVTINGVPADEAFVEALQNVFTNVFSRVGDSLRMVGGAGVAISLIILGFALMLSSDVKEPPVVVIG